MDFFYRHVNKKYKMVPEKDRDVIVVPFYKGPLSKITMRAADKMFAEEDNQLALRQADGDNSSTGSE
jgi:hypothetical protein